MKEKTQRFRKVAVGMLTPVALIASSVMVYQASNAAFTASTTNGSNTWSSGSVVISDDDAANVMFAVTGMTPGATGTKCINVTYNGSLPAAVRLYASPFNDGGLGQYLDFTVEEGTGAAGGATQDCTGFATPVSRFSGTLGSLGTTHTSYATGITGWNPSGSATKSYRFTYTLQDNSAAQNKNVSATFVWEAQNS